MSGRRRLLLTTCLVFAIAVFARAQQQPPTNLFHVASADAVFDGSVVHDISLRVNSQDWQTLKDHFLDNTYYPADIAIDDAVVRNIGIKSRGSGSRSGTKPGLKLDFSRYTSGQQFFGLKSLVLRNNTQDPSNMRERLSMLLFARLGLPAPREAFARLWINKHYAGLYTVVEPLDTVFVQRALGQSGGYLYSYDYPTDAPPYNFEYRGSDPNVYVPTPFSPETHTSDPQPEVIERWIEAINLSSDAAFRSAIAPYVDLQAFVQFVAIETFLGDDDGVLGNWGMNNFYSYRPENTTQFGLLPWDKSDAFIAGYTPSIWHNISDNPPEHKNRLMMRALAYPDVYNAYLDAETACVSAINTPTAEHPDGPGWLESEIQNEYAQIREAALADPVKPFTNDQFEQSVAALIDFARHRGNFVANEVAQARGVTVTR
jgi:spore coat protein CotH